MLNQVFISYRHESPEHARAVRRLGELLKQINIPVELDQFFQDEHPGGPDIGWPKWCEDNANKSACVLIIASQGWFAAYDKDETTQPGKGLGAATEADLFRQEFWNERGNNARIRLAFLHNVTNVPVRLQTWHSFRPFDTNAELDLLIRWIAGCLGLHNIEPPTVRWPEPVTFQPDLANRIKKEWPAVADLLAGRSHKRILLLEGARGLGKSEIVRQAIIYAKKLELPIARVDFKGGKLSTEDVLGRIDLELGVHLPNFSREGGIKTHLLCKDLRALRRPVLFIFDSYEDADVNKTVTDWLNQQFLTEVETALSLAVIVAGQKVPDFPNALWRDLALHLPLEPITELEHWEGWVLRHYPSFKEKGDLLTALKLSHGNPSVMANFCAAIANS
jgi:hypothetical protein